MDLIMTDPLFAKVRPDPPSTPPPAHLVEDSSVFEEPPAEPEIEDVEDSDADLQVALTNVSVPAPEPSSRDNLVDALNLETSKPVPKP